MLINLLRRFLGRYKRLLLVVLALQGVQAIASLYLPSLNSDVIDRGVMTGDTGYIWRTGGLMLLITIVQLAFSIVAVYFGSRAAMGVGRDVRRALFHQVTGFSAYEVNTFGPPSLINRITNDVQQVQMFVVLTCTLALAAPITAIGGVLMAMRQTSGSPGSSWSASRCCWPPSSPSSAGWCRSSARCRGASTASTGYYESRSPVSGSCGRSCASRRSVVASGR